MKNLLLLGSMLGFFLSFPAKTFAQCANADSVFISEIHYDNNGPDVNEGVEISGPAGTDLSCYQIVLYNGSTGNTYNTINLSGTIDDEGCGYGAVWFAISGIQNGSPDGIALVNTCNGNNVIMFISYEGSFTANNGPAAGLASTNIGVNEPSSANPTESLQLSGAGYCYSSIVAAGGWQPPAANTAGNLNSGLTNLTTCSVGPPDSLVFSQFVCVELNQNTTFDVCAVDTAGNTVTSYTGTITISLNSGPGNMTGTLTSTAVNGCATFSVSFDALGDYVLDATDGTLVGVSDTLTVSSSCPPPCPLLHRHLVNSCVGSEGINEYAVIQNGNATITVDDIKVTFPNGGSFCNSGCGTQNWVSNTTYVNQLNATAGCSPPLFVDAIANGGTIPPGATIVVFTGANPTDVLDFTNECGNGPYYAIFANNTDVSGRYVNYRPDCADTRTTVIEIGACSPSSYTYQPCMLGNNDGDMVIYDAAGNPTYTNDTSCSVILPVVIQDFSLIKKQDKVEVFWEIQDEIKYLQLLKSDSPNKNFYAIAENLGPKDNYTDFDLNASELFYKLRWQNIDGNWQESNVINVRIAGKLSIKLFPNPVRETVTLQGVSGQTALLLMNQTGQVLLQAEVNTSQEATQILNSVLSGLSQGTYLLKIGKTQKLLIKL